MSTVTIAHWDPRLATTDPEAEMRVPMYGKERTDDTHRILPVCPRCNVPVKGYTYPGGESPQTAIGEWERPMPIKLRPCLHRVETTAIGLSDTSPPREVRA